MTDVISRYGFIMYHNYDDAENCIRAFYFLGYEAKFAKVPSQTGFRFGSPL